jgi:photosystem II stability/assembly factor-like uncharacterized protein
MRILAGTSRGVFVIDSNDTNAGNEGGGEPESVLQSRGVRDLYLHRVNAGSAPICFAGTGAGLYRSTDAGDSWTQVGFEEEEVWQVRGVGNLLYAGTQPAGLYRSTDAGATWEPVDSFMNAPEASDWCVPVEPKLPGRARAIVVDPDDPRRVLVGVEVGGIMATEDGGESWRLTLPGDNPDLHMLSLHPTEPNTVFASTGYGRLDGVAEMVEGNAGVFRSEDFGRSWQYAWRGITPRYSRPMCIDPRQPVSLTVASAPTAFSNFKEPDGAGAMLFRSVDGGESWHSLVDAAHSPSRANIHGLTPDPSEGGGVVIGTDTGEVWRVNTDSQWTCVATGIPAVLALGAIA